MKTAIINQRWGLGDHIFTVSICQMLIDEGYHLIYPVLPQYVEGNQRAYPQIEWADCEKMLLSSNFNARADFEDGLGRRWIPLAWSMEIAKCDYKDVMRAKYDMYGLDFKDWKKHAKWQRDAKHERRLFEGLGLKSGDKFILVNENYQSDMKGKTPIHVDTKHKIIRMTDIPEFSLFDWALVIERAEEVHTVSTSLFYILELLKLKSPAHLYPRNNDPDFSHIKYLFTKDYILHV